MPNIGRGDDDIILTASKDQGLCREDHVSVKGFVVRSRPSLLARVCPQFGGLAHHSGGKRDIIYKLFEIIQAFEPLLFIPSEKLTAQLIVSDLGDTDVRSLCKK